MPKLYFSVDAVIQETGVSSIYKGTITSKPKDDTCIKVSTRKYNFKEGSQYVLKIYGDEERYSNEHAVFDLLLQNPHPYVLTPVMSDRSTLIAFFKAADDDLFNYCESNTLTLGQKNTISIRIIEAMKHLHSLGVLHADMKLENIIYFGEPDNLQVIDFTHSKVVERIDRTQKWRQMIGTKSLAAPELHRGFNYDHTLKIDSWLLALVLYELYTWTDPLQNGKGLSLKRKLIDDPALYKTIAALTHQDPEARLSIEDIDTSIFMK